MIGLFILSKKLLAVVVFVAGKLYLRVANEKYYQINETRVSMFKILVRKRFV